MIYNILCWSIAFIFYKFFILLYKDYFKYGRGDKLQLILLILDIIFIVLLATLPIFKIILML